MPYLIIINPTTLSLKKKKATPNANVKYILCIQLIQLIPYTQAS
jgi:hypothetical protein